MIQKQIEDCDKLMNEAKNFDVNNAPPMAFRKDIIASSLSLAMKYSDKSIVEFLEGAGFWEGWDEIYTATDC